MKNLLREKSEPANLFRLLAPFILSSHLIIFVIIDDKIIKNPNAKALSTLITCLSTLVNYFMIKMTHKNHCQPKLCWSALITCLSTLVKPAARHTDNAAELPSPAPRGISLELTIDFVTVLLHDIFNISYWAFKQECLEIIDNLIKEGDFLPLNTSNCDYDNTWTHATPLPMDQDPGSLCTGTESRSPKYSNVHHHQYQKKFKQNLLWKIEYWC